MISLTADDTTLLKDMRLFVEPVEIYDKQGKLLGLFVPANLERGKEMYARATARIDWAEVERRSRANDKGEPVAVVRKRLKLLELEIERRKVTGQKEFTKDEALAYFRSLREQENSPTPAPASSPVPVEAGQCDSP